MKPYSFVLLSAPIVVAALVAQSARPADADWPMYSRDVAGTKYSPLSQINTANVATLSQAWTVRLVPAAGRRGAAPAPAGQAAAGAPSTTEEAANAGAGAPGRQGAGGPVARGGAADAFGNPPGNPEATPIVIGGVMYLPVGSTRILALDA